MRIIDLSKHIASQPGTYAVVLEVLSATDLQIGRLGYFHVQSGFYVYCGSAFGSGGVRARLTHHSHVTARPHWHIDYLRQSACLQQIWYSYDGQRREHQWAEVCQNLPGAMFPWPRFGASDCRCRSHLLYFPVCPTFPAFRQCLQKMHHGHAAVSCLHLVAPQL